MQKQLLLLMLGVAGYALQGETVVLRGGRPAPGNVMLLEIPGSPEAADVVWDQHQYPCFFQGKRCVALVPVPMDTPPGPQHLQVVFKDTLKPALTWSFTVTQAHYRTVRIRVAKGKTQLSEQDQKRALQEQETLQALLKTPTAKRLWAGPFLLPTQKPVTCEYGVKRMFNGTVQSVHRGIDLRAPSRTPIAAANGGTVRLAQDLFYGGKTVLLDHGLGLFTVYCHLSDCKVFVGQVVQKGQIIALSGATGRVSGPHLHWGVNLGGHAIDPLAFRQTLEGLEH